MPSFPTKDSAKGITEMLNARRSLEQLPDFFWKHLHQDFEILHKTLGRSIDEVSIIVHLVLQDILRTNPKGKA